MSIEIAIKPTISQETYDNFSSDLKEIIGDHIYITSMSMQMFHNTNLGFHILPDKDFDKDSVIKFMEKYKDDIFVYHFNG